MLRKRIVGVVIIKDNVVVQSYNFSKYLPVGRPEIAIEYLNRWGIDEIVLLDIDATPQNRKPFFEKLSMYAKFAQVPISYGGGITEVKDMEWIIQNGFEKIVLNSALVSDPDLVAKGAHLFGNQSIVASIDVRLVKDVGYSVLTHGGRIATAYTPVELAKQAEDAGAGEIFLTSIDRDGSRRGYDLLLIKQLVESVNIPVIVCGGVGYPWHFLEGIDCGASAVAAGNFFHFTEHSVILSKQFLKQQKDDDSIRLDSYVTYEGFGFDKAGRLSKRDDDYLEFQRFQFVPEEVI